MEPIGAPVRDDAEIENAIAALARKTSGGLIVMPDIYAVISSHLPPMPNSNSMKPVTFPPRDRYLSQLQALARETGTIPLVGAQVGDLVAAAGHKSTDWPYATGYRPSTETLLSLATGD